MGQGMRVQYRLAESYFSIAGTVEYETDRFGGGERLTASQSAATVVLGVRADASAELTVDFDSDGGDDDFTITRTVDGRLASASFNTAGVGARIVSASATVLAFVGGIAASIVGAPLPEGTTEDDDATTREAARRAAHDKRQQDAEQKAREAWAGTHAIDAELLAKHTEILATAAKASAEARARAVAAESPGDQSAALARARRMDAVVAASQREVDRLDTLYKAWRAGTITRRTESRSYDLAIHDLAAHAGRPPRPGELTDRSREVWNALGVIVQVEVLGDPLAGREPEPERHRRRVDPRVVLLTGATYAAGEAPSIGDEIRWRVPRPARIWIWRRGPDASVILDRLLTALVVDRECQEGFVRIDRRLFGEHEGSIEFGDLGVPTKITQAEKGAFGALADALKGVPEAVVGGLDSATKASTAFTGLQDARSERLLARLKRRLETEQAELDRRGLAATAGDFARLKALEQRVAIAEAEETLAPPTELQQLKEELELVRTRAALRDAAAGEMTEAAATESLEAQVADLAERVAKLEKQAE